MQSEKKNTPQSLWLPVLIWLFLVYLYVQILDFNQGNISNPMVGGMYFIQFGIHEASHIVMMFFPAVVTAASGSLSEIVFTGLITFAAVRAKSYMAAAFGLIWVMLAMTSAGRYMADAVPQVMPLIGPGASPQHDWHFVFSELGWLAQSAAIGDSVRIIGYVVGALGLLLGLLLIVGAASKRT